MKHIRFLIMLAGVLFVFHSLRPVSVTADSSGELKKANGKVDIELKEYTLDDRGREIPWQDMSQVLPGQKIVKIPKVTNLAAKCRIRAKIQMEMGREVEHPVTEEMLSGMPQGWSRKEDGYYYYDKWLEKGDSVTLFQSFTIPSFWDTKYNDAGEIEKYYTENKIDITVTVEAVGEENWEGEKTVVHSPKTGDNGKMLFFAAAVLLSAGIFLLAAAGKRRRFRI